MNKKLLALDQSSKITGWAVYNNGELEEFGKFNIDDMDIVSRLLKIQEQIELLFDQKQITHVAIEEIQLQASNNNVVTFKTLAFVMAAILLICKENNIPCETISSSTWKSACGVKGRDRASQKKDAQRFVEESFGIKATQDIVDAICLGFAISKKDKTQINWG